MPSFGVGGICVADGRVYVGSRDTADAADVWTAVDLKTGATLWSSRHPQTLDLDYGNSPRATPAYAEGPLVVVGGVGAMHCLDAAAGIALWSLEYQTRFRTEVPVWGFGSSPLIADDRVFVQVGAGVPAAALDLLTGETVWAAGGSGSPHASLLPVRVGGRRLLAGVDADGTFLRDSATGEAVWSERPDYFEEFGVPAAVAVPRGLVFTGENVGVRRFAWNREGLAIEPEAVNEDVTPDAHTPVAVGGQLLTAHEGLRSLDAETLTVRWVAAEDAVRGYASIIASLSEDGDGGTALALTEASELLLLHFTDTGATVADRRPLGAGEQRTLSHPAISGDRLLLRVGRELRCYQMAL